MPQDRNGFHLRIVGENVVNSVIIIAEHLGIVGTRHFRIVCHLSKLVKTKEYKTQPGCLVYYDYGKMLIAMTKRVTGGLGG